MLYIPSEDDIRKLALDTPVLYQALSFALVDGRSFDEAMRLAVATMAMQLKSTQDALKDCMARSVALTPSPGR